MKHEFCIRKTSWGIFVSIDAEETNSILISDFKVIDNIYLRVNCEQGQFKKSVISWFSRAILDIAEKIQITEKTCFEIKKIDFNECHFQEEGLYYVMLGWLSKRYNLEVSPIDAYYNKDLNKYIFPQLYSVRV